MLYAENNQHGTQAMCTLIHQKHMFHPPDKMKLLTNKLLLHLQSQCTAGTSSGGCSPILGQSKFKGKQSPTFPTGFTHHKSFFPVLLHQSTHCSPYVSSGQHSDLCARLPPPPTKSQNGNRRNLGMLVKDQAKGHTYALLNHK